jgi:hypothetical protein
MWTICLPTLWALNMSRHVMCWNVCLMIVTVTETCSSFTLLNVLLCLTEGHCSQSECIWPTSPITSVLIMLPNFSRASFCVIRPCCNFLNVYVLGEFKTVWRRLYTTLGYWLVLCPPLFFVHEDRNIFFDTVFCSLFGPTGLKIHVPEKMTSQAETWCSHSKVEILHPVYFTAARVCSSTSVRCEALPIYLALSTAFLQTESRRTIT